MLAVLAMATPGCGLGGGGEDATDTRAADAAAAYQEAIDTFAADLEGAKGKKKDLKPILAESPELEEIASDDASYAEAAALAERLDPMVDELDLLAKLDPKQEDAFENKLYGKALGFGADVIGRSTDYLFNNDIETSVFGSDDELYRLAKQAIQKEVESWPRYRREVAAVPARTEILRSLQEFELSLIDDEIAIFKEYANHLRQNSAKAAVLSYYDDIWPDEDPVRLLPGGVFSSGGDPYFKTLQRGQRIIRSLGRGISELAGGDTVDSDSPSVGDGYREAIVAGFVSPLEKEKYTVYKVGYRAWMLARIRELEGTPRETYEAALDTLNLELLDDSRNTYTQFLSLLAGFNGSIVNTPRDLPGLKAYLDLAVEKLAGPHPPILDPTRRGFLRALDLIDRDVLEAGFGADRGKGLKGLSDSFKAQDKARRQYEQAKKKIENVLRTGAREVDSPKKLKRALKDAVGATRPGEVAAAGEEEAEGEPAEGEESPAAQPESS